LAQEIADGIYWVGIYLGKDAKLSLNAFLLKDEKTALIDTGAIPTREAVLKNIKEIVEPSTIRYIILSHSCVDHCGGLGRLLEVAPDAEVIGSEIAAASVALYGLQPKVSKGVKDGETLSLGKKKLRFISAPYLDKLDSMFIYEEVNEVLFTADAFGTWSPEWKLFADGDMSEALTMYNNMIFGGPQRLSNALERIRGLNIKIIAPGHGSMLKSNIEKYIRLLSINHPIK